MRLETTQILRWFWAGLLGLAVLGCSAPPAEPLRIGTHPWPGYELFYLARELGYLPPAQAQLVEYPSATEVLLAFRSQRLSAAALTLDEALLLAETGIPIRIVLVLDISHGGDVILGQPEITSLAQLRGKRIGFESSALGAYLLSRGLESAGLEPEAVTGVPLSLDQHAAAFLRGRVDALVTFEPVRGKLLAAGANLLFDSRQIPGEIVDVLVVREEAVATQPAQVAAVVEGWFKARTFLHSQPQRAAHALVPRLNIEGQAFLASLEGLTLPGVAENRVLLGQPPKLLETAIRLERLMRARGLLRGPLKLEALFRAPFLPGAGNENVGWADDRKPNQ